MSALPKVLVADDEPNMEWLFRSSFGDEFEILGARSGEEALEKLAHDRVDLVMLDLKLPGMDGMTALKQIKHLYPQTPVVMMTAYGTVKTAVEAMKMGAHDYVTKPFDVEELRMIMENSMKFGRLAREVEQLRDQLQEKYHIKNIIAASQSMLSIFQLIEKVTTTDASVLIEGESGTGKELVARAIHWESPRRAKPFLPVNCAALPENLLESELFGYEEGAFTGARRKKPGKFELADGGTIFLDEIGDLPRDMQAKVLRVLEEKEIERLGGTRRIPVDIRVICATNRSLRAQIEKGEFREDLYYRLAVIPIRIPPLRERREDIPLLVTHFLKTFSEESGGRLHSVSPEAMDLLKAHNWPGNVRELRNVIQQAAVLGEGSVLTPALLPEHIRVAAGAGAGAVTAATPEDVRRGRPAAGGLKGRLSEFKANHERQIIAEALARCGGNRTRAAAALGISRRSLQMKIKEFNLQ
ncbi:MAG: sigma-54-dependent Fis family transcriptional regulator [Firmicutes bacterium]|nr:sigma-54-dependent Fis family transcriptional regulator [Bacillota bacterium]